ncbi:hypothetical protein [Cardinium endosymbiont of Nabis limbatus]|uniref:hypothetical protein n=1 Tax=Cardinium endosymbiont of Nabis limbatus TaxID=3066217 RepID=UPI003AF34166
MFPYHLPYIFFKQKKLKSLIVGINFLFFLCFSFFSHAKGKQKITTPHFNLLFDASATDLTQRVANTLEAVYKPVCRTLGVYPSPIRLVINNTSAHLNAHFKPIPRHIYFYTLYNPDPNFIGNVDWLDMLCIHEFRHAAQHSIEYHSTPRWLKPLYFGAGLVTVCGVSPFFKEGDSVGIETALSKSGRGRLPGWEKLYKVNLLERDTVSFSRQLFGSSKHEVPCYYHLGYYFTTHIRRKYGISAIKSIFEHTMRSIPYFGFYNAIKKVTKKSILGVYKDMNEELLLSWQKQLAGLKITPAIQLTIKKADDSFNYTHPFMDASGNLMAWKQGIGFREQLVQVKIASSKPTAANLRKDKTILYIHETTLPAPALGEGCAAWLETCKHPWQGNKQTIRLQYYDLKTKKRKTLVSNSRYTALAISPSTRQLVAVTTDKAGNHFLVVLETKSGKVVKKIDNPDAGYYLTPSWSGEDHIVVVKTKNQQNSILQINIATNTTEVLLPYTYEHRSYPRIYKDYLLYNSSYNGIDNIYAMHLPTKACFQVTSRKYGAYLGMVDPVSNQLIFNDYTKNGMDIAVMPFDPLLWTPLEEVEDRSVRYYEPLVAQEQNSNILEKVSVDLHPLTSYHFKDDLTFTGTSIAPNWEDRGLTIEPFTLGNLEDTLKVTPYLYQNSNLFNKVRDSDYKSTELGLKVKYTTCYPILAVDVKTSRHKIKNKDSSVRLLQILRDGGDTFAYINQSPSKVFWKGGLNAAIKFPYYFTLASSSGEAYIKAAIKDLSRCEISKKITHTAAYSFFIKNSSTKSKRDIHAPWYQQIEIGFKDYKNSPIRLENTAYLNSTFCFPGMASHHYFSLKPTLNRLTSESCPPFWSGAIQISYGAPIAYPEWGIPLICFLEKIWIEGYYKLEERGINRTGINEKLNCENATTDIIGTKLYFSSRVLFNINIPVFNFSMDFGFLKKSNENSWKFEFQLPKFNCEFDIFNQEDWF